MPFDPIWQFLDNPIDNNCFISKDYSKLDIQGHFSYSDSIQQNDNFDKLTQLERTNTRIITCGIKNNLIQKQVDENILQITNAKYNIAIDTLNYGIDGYNLFIANKNRQFRNPRLEDLRIKEMITNAGSGIFVANELFHELFSANNELNVLIIDARNRMPSLISDLEREKDFVEIYLRKWKPLRIFMTYGY